MNVAYVHSVRWPSNSPAVTFVGMTAAGLAKAGCTTHLFVKRGSPETPEEVYRKVFDREIPAGLHIHAIRGDIAGLLRTNRLFYHRVANVLGRMIRERAIDVVVSRSCTFLPMLAVMSRRYRVQTWFESHDFYADLSRRDDLRGRRWQRYEKLERRWIPRLTGLICLQQCQRRLYSSVFPDLRIIVARSGLDTVHIPRRRCDRSALVYVGSLDSHKGVRMLLEAVAASTVRPPVVVVGAKSSNEYASLRALAEALGIGNTTMVYGWLGKGELGEIVGGAVGGAVPLQDTFFNRCVTSPLKIFDYYRYGVPVLGADLPTVRELVREGETGMLFRPDDPASLAAAIDRLWVLDDTAYGRMTACVRRQAEGLRWEHRGEQLRREFALQDGG